MIIIDMSTNNHMYKLYFILFLIFISIQTNAGELTPEVREFARKTAIEGGIRESAVLKWLEKAELCETCIAMMDRQTEAKPWKEYRPYFINDKKISKGIEFKKRYPKTLAKAQRQYGVDPYVIVAILGVETDYGTYELSHRAMDALYSLAFFYPRRAEYFRNELAALMVYAYKNKIDPYSLKSSYAGAVGMPQFMPSNIIKFGREFSGDGRINIFKSGADSIGSIANYLYSHGWVKGEPLTVKAYVSGDRWQKYLDQGYKPKHTVAQMRKDGIKPSMWTNPKRKAALVSLEADGGTEYWMVFDNFYAVTRYNPSIKYAMAVAILARYIEIRSK